MNKFCENCPHRNLPEVLRKFFERYTWPHFFHNCPVEDSTIIGCIRKEVSVDWKDYANKLKEKDLLPEDFEVASNGE